MPPFEEEEDAVSLTDLLRTGEASRLRRRGAMRNGHRREVSEDLTMPLSRRARLERAGQRRDDQVYLELTCGARTAHISGEPSSSSRPSPLPQSRQAIALSNIGFVYSSTGCGTVVNSAALPSQQGCNSAHQVYISTDISNVEIARLPSRYLEPDQRSIAEFLSRDDGACKCDWEAIGCRVCGNPLGFLYVPCIPGHSLGLYRIGAQSTHVFFPSSVTPSPSYTFPPVDPAPYGSLLRLAPVSESDDMSIDSPTFSPRVQLVAEDDARFRFNSQDQRLLDFFDFSQANDLIPPPTVNHPRSPHTPTLLALPTTSQEQLPDQSQARPAFDHSFLTPRRSPQEPRRFSRTDSHPPGSRGQSSGSRMTTRHSYAVASRPRTSQEISDDEWNAFLERDRAPSSARRSFEGQSDQFSQHPWVPRELRERPSGALMPGERAADRLASITYPESPESTVPQFTFGAAPPARPPEPPALHRMPRRSLSTMIPTNRRSLPFDPSPWRPRTLPPGTARPTFVSERTEHTRDERGLRMSRWATVPSVNGIPRRRPNNTTSTPAFTLVDSAGEPSYPPSAQSSMDDRDTLSVESDADVSRMPSHFYDYLLPVESGLGDVGQSWGSDVHTDEPEADDEEKVEEEQQTGERSTRERRSQFLVRSRELVLDERSVSSVSQLPLG